MSTRTWFIGIPAVVAVCLIFLWVNFHLVPDPMPIHIGPSGEPDSWTRKSFGSAVVLISLAPAMLLLTGAASAGLTYAVARDAGERQRMLAREMMPSLAAWMFWMASGIAVGVTGSLLGHSGPLSSLVLVGFLLVVTAVFAWQMVRMRRRVDAQFPPGEREQRARFGFYYNPDDPETFVSLEIGLNTTLNFARPGAWAVLAGLLAVPTLIVILAVVAG